MKRFLALLAALSLTFCLAGCAEKDAEGSQSDASGAGTGATGEGSYSDLSIMDGVQLGDEEFYGIAFRKGSDMVDKVDEITEELFKDGTLAGIAKTYGLTGNLVDEFKRSDDSNPSGDSDYDYIKKKGTLVVGITDFDPMNYKNDKGEWIGFDTEYAQAVGEKLGVSVEFKEIVWDNKEMELDAKSIDCLWNGMTITDAMLNAADVTGAYIKNYQAVVVKDTGYTTLESLKDKKVVAEGGSAGEDAAKADGNLNGNYKAVESQADALLQVKSGQADACVIDFIMANSLLNK